MQTFLTIVHVVLCLFLIGVVLLQSGRSGGMGVLSGASSQQVFGGSGAGNFLQKTTSVVAVLFLLTCSTLAWLATSTRDRSLATTSTDSTTSANGGVRDAAVAEASAAPAVDPTTTSLPVLLTSDAAAAAPTAETAPTAAEAGVAL